MNEWKVRQQVTHRLHEHTDLSQDDQVVVMRRGAISELDFQAEIVAYFLREGDGRLYYPQKAYSVALVYAKLLQRYFDEDFYEVLNDADLLLGDKHFVPYSKDKGTYDELILLMSHANLWDFENNPISQVRATVSYFKKEFLLD